MTYAEKLKDPRWQKKRLEILQRDEWACVHCGDKKSTLHVHHKKYTGDPFDAPNKDLETTCKYCHSLIEFYKSIPNYKFKRFNCSMGKLFMIMIKDSGMINFEIVDEDGSVIELTAFSKEIIYGLKKFFK